MDLPVEQNYEIDTPSRRWNCYIELSEVSS